MTITEASDVNTVVLWAMGRRARYQGGLPLTAEEVTAAARRLIARAEKTLMAGLRPDEVTIHAGGEP